MDVFLENILCLGPAKPYQNLKERAEEKKQFKMQMEDLR